MNSFQIRRSRLKPQYGDSNFSQNLPNVEYETTRQFVGNA